MAGQRSVKRGPAPAARPSSAAGGGRRRGPGTRVAAARPAPYRSEPHDQKDGSRPGAGCVAHNALRADVAEHRLRREGSISAITDSAGSSTACSAASSTFGRHVSLVDAPLCVSAVAARTGERPPPWPARQGRVSHGRAFQTPCFGRQAAATCWYWPDAAGRHECHRRSALRRGRELLPESANRYVHNGPVGRAASARRSPATDEERPPEPHLVGTCGTARPTGERPRAKPAQ